MSCTSFSNSTCLLLSIRLNDKCAHNRACTQDKLPQKNILIEKTWSLRTNDDFNTVVNWYFGMATRERGKLAKLREAGLYIDYMHRPIFPIHFEKLSAFILVVDFFFSRLKYIKRADLNCQTKWLSADRASSIGFAVFLAFVLIFRNNSRVESSHNKQSHKPNTYVRFFLENV